MITVFADSYYYLAMVNVRDRGYAKALQFGDSFRGHIITTEWILTEVGDALAKSHNRLAFVAMLNDVQNDAHTTIVQAGHDLFTRGIELFKDRSDKEWTLTDCISFVVMEDHGIRESLTGDHHFEQAGFVALLR
jgi:predicted nucleic acid-binding protein